MPRVLGKEVEILPRSHENFAALPLGVNNAFELLLIALLPFYLGASCGVTEL